MPTAFDLYDLVCVQPQANIADETEVKCKIHQDLL